MIEKLLWLLSLINLNGFSGGARLGKGLLYLLAYNNTALLIWMILKTCIAMCDFECHKRFWLSSLDTNLFLDEMVKDSIQQMVRIRVRIVGSIHGSVMLRCNNAALFMLTTLRTCLTECDFECRHKRFRLNSLTYKYQLSFRYDGQKSDPTVSPYQFFLLSNYELG